MIRVRVIPVLLLRGRRLVKSIRYRGHRYIGDPVNAVKVFNDKEVDELCLLDIDATREGRDPPFSLVREIASEAFMPVSYGGGVGTLAHVERLFAAGVEKIVTNTALATAPRFVEDVAKRYGAQAVVASIDAKKGLLGGYKAMTTSGTKGTGEAPDVWARRAVDHGAGEVLLTSIDRDGTFSGYDVALTRKVADAVDVPVVACGGARSVEDMVEVVTAGRASAVAAGSMFVFIGERRGVLINFPSQTELRRLFEAG